MNFGSRLRTDGERWLAQYFVEVHGWREGDAWDYEPELPGKVKRPDFRLRAGDPECMLEVKDFGENLSEISMERRTLRPFSRIRGKIEEGRRQLREFRDDFGCALVLRSGPTSDTAVNDPRRVVAAFLGIPGVEPLRNSTIGALITLRRLHVPAEASRAAWRRLIEVYDGNLPPPGIGLALDGQLGAAGLGEDQRVLSASVYVNPQARTPFPSWLFHGPFDECWTVQDGRLRRTYVGEGLLRVIERAHDAADHVARRIAS